MTENFRRFLFTANLVCLLLIVTALPSLAMPQRDHLTDQETEAVRLNQELDKRIAVFIKAAERRFSVLADPTGAAAKVSKKELELYGPLPTGTRQQLLDDVARILDEAVDKIDDVALHDEKNPLLMKALKKLDEAAVRFLPQLKSIGEATSSKDERYAAERAAAQAQEIIEASKSHGL
jgi:hypothetical protein